MPSLPSDPKARKSIPLAGGLVDYFPASLIAVAQVSAAGNEQHHAGKPLHHDRSKSTDHADALLRHFFERGTVDSDGIRHSVKVAWRALALAQEELEREEGAPLPRNARCGPSTPVPEGIIPHKIAAEVMAARALEIDEE